VDGERLLRALATVREHGTPEEQLTFLRVLFARVEVLQGGLSFVYPGDLLPPTERAAPRYFGEQRGSLGF